MKTALAKNLRKPTAALVAIAAIIAVLPAHGTAPAVDNAVTAASQIVTVGQTDITVPLPEGFVWVTKEMDAVYQLYDSTANTINSLLGSFITEADAEIALRGEIPELQRTFSLQVNRQAVDLMINARQFDAVKQVTKDQNDEITKLAGSDTVSQLVSKGISNAVDMDVVFEITKVLPLPPHHDSENAFAFSMYMDFSTSVADVQEADVVAVTTSLVNVSGKVLYFYAYAPKDELEWTRIACQTWVDATLAANAPAPASSSMFNWTTVGISGLIGAAVGGLFALIQIGLKAIRKRKAA